MTFEVNLSVAAVGQRPLKVVLDWSHLTEAQQQTLAELIGPFETPSNIELRMCQQDDISYVEEDCL